MKILIFYQYFTTPKGSWGTRVYEFAKEWVKEGHEVTVVSSIYSKSDLKASKLIETQYFDGIEVKVVNVLIDNKQPIPKRIFTFVYYALVSSWYAIFKRADIVIASSGPITIGLPGLLSKLFRNGKFVFEIRDIWPEIPILVGAIKNPLLKKLAFYLEKTLYKKASLVVGLSPGMRDYVKENHKHPNVISVTNACNLELFGKEITPFTNDLLKSTDTYAIYTGNIGELNNSKWLLDTARYLKKIKRLDIKIVLAGDGQLREELCEIASKENLENFIYIGQMPKIELVSYIKNSIASLVPLQSSPILNTSSPNKLFESLASGVPVIQTTNGWIKEYLDTNKVGYSLKGDSAKELGNLLINMTDNPSKTAQMKINAVACAKRDFDQLILSKKYLNALKEII